MFHFTLNWSAPSDTTQGLMPPINFHLNTDLYKIASISTCSKTYQEYSNERDWPLKSGLYSYFYIFKDFYMFLNPSIPLGPFPTAPNARTA